MPLAEENSTIPEKEPIQREKKNSYLTVLSLRMITVFPSDEEEAAAITGSRHAPWHL